MLASSRAFVINQFGLSCFAWDGQAYRPKTFNLYVFPRPAEGSDKRFVCQVGAQGAGGSGCGARAAARRGEPSQGWQPASSDGPTSCRMASTHPGLKPGLFGPLRL